MNNDSDNPKPQHSKNILARFITALVAMSAIFAAYKLLGIDYRNFWPFMILVVGASFIGSYIGPRLAQKIANK